MKISACLMVKNESSNLPRCLKALNALGVIDEIVVVDTGSTDDTVEIARAAGARVVIPEDIESLFVETEFGKSINFSKARNLTIEHATGDWLYLLDADEETVGSAEDLPEFLSKFGPDQDAVALQFEDYKKGKCFMSFLPARIFRRGRIKYKGIVHNKPTGFHEPAIFYPGIKIKHTGFDLTPEQSEVKRRRTLGLLNLQLKMDPEAFWPYFYIAGIYGDLQDYPATIAASVKYIENRDKVGLFNHSIYYLLAQACILGNSEVAADKWIGAAILELPDDMDIAAAVCDFGAWRKAPHILATGCEMYLRAWGKMEKDPIALGSRFIYNYNPETLARVLFHISHLRLQQGAIHLNRLRELMPKLDPWFAEAIEVDLKREHETIGVSWIKRAAGGGDGGGGPKHGQAKKNRKKRGWPGGRIQSRKVRGGGVQGARISGPGPGTVGVL